MIRSSLDVFVLAGDAARPAHGSCGCSKVLLIEMVAQIAAMTSQGRYAKSAYR
jgi:hypothetical protein